MVLYKNKKGMDNMNRKSISILVCFAMLITSLLSPSQSMAKKAKLKLNKKKVTLQVGKSVKLKVKGTKKKAKWKSSNKKIATVSSKGKVKAKKKGNARITAKIGKKKLVCKVTVKAAKKSAASDSDPTSGGSQPSNAQPTTGANAPSNPQATAGTNGPSDAKPTEDADGPSKPQTTGGAEETAKPQATENGNATAEPKPTGNGTATADPKPTGNGTATTKPQPTGNGTATMKPQPTESGTATAKPQPTGSGNATAKPQATEQPKPTSGSTGTAVPATEQPKPTNDGKQTAAPATESPKPVPTQEPVILPTTVKEASFEEGTDGFTAQRNASISVVENGYGEGNCLQVSNRTAATDGVVYSAGEEVTAGESYTIQGYVKAASGTIKCMYRTGDADTDVHELASVSVSGEWVKFMGTLTVPEGFSKLDIWFELDDPEESFFIDEVKILQIVSIKNSFDRIFGKTGTCINPSQLEDPETLAYVKKHYSSITLENDMKPDFVLGWGPNLISTEIAKTNTDSFVIPDSYQEDQVPKMNFNTVDKVLRIAKENGLKIRYHVLVWHSQSPEWFFKEGYKEDGAYVSKETMNARMEMYIRSVIHHVYTLDGGAYRDVVYTWDIVNEYFSSEGENGSLKGKFWSGVYGNCSELGTKPDYVKRAFEIAYSELEKLSLEEAVPLFYNDFNTYMTTDKIIEMIHYVNSDKKVCSGIGMQSHIGVTFPTVNDYVYTVQRFIEEDFQVQITELDIACVDKDEQDPAKIAAGYETQAAYVKDLTEKLINLQRSTGYQITGLTWWGMYDAMSWVPTHALMFHEGLYDAKPSYYAFMEAASEMDKPAPTPPPLRKYDFEEDPYQIEASDKASHVINDDGSITLTFNGGGAYDFFLPQSEWGGVDYKSVVLTYTSEGGDLGHSLFDANAVGTSNVQAGKHTDWGNKIKNTQGAEKKLIFNVGDDFAGGCIRGIQFFTQSANVTITIKSMIFCGKTNPTKYDLDPTLNPPVKPTMPPTAKPTVVPPTPAVTAEPTAAPTPLSQVKFDFSNEDSYYIEDSGKVSHVVNEDGSITISFKGGGAYDFFLPERYWNGVAYKSLELTYTSEGGDLGHALYDADMVGSGNINAGKHPDWSQQIKATGGVEKKLVLRVTDECVGGCIRGLQIFTQSSETTITIKSMIFRDVASLDVSNLSGGEKTDDGVVLNDIEQVTIPLPKLDDLTKGSKVEVTVSGTLAENSDGFRMWLADGTTTASDQYYYTKSVGVGLGGRPGDGDPDYQAGAFTVTGQLTVGNNTEAVKLDTANNLLIKAPVYQGRLNGITITDICVRSLDSATHRWVTTWGTAEERCSIKENDDRMPKLPLEDTTVRQIIRVTTGGEKLRLRLSNQYGESDVTVKSLHLAKQVKADASTIDPATDQVVTVDGKEEFVIPKGKVIITDAVDFPVNALENVAITSYFGASPTQNITGHRGARATTYQVSGNHVSDETLTDPQTTLSWFFLADVSIWSTKESKAVVCFGDSITDGYGTDADYLGKKPDSYTRWVDYFAKRLQANDKTKHISVINEGIGSNSIMGAYPTDAGKDRFARDLLKHDGVGYCIILFGVNDLNQLQDTAKYDELLPEYQKMVKLCHDNGIKVYGAPILPFGTSSYYSDASEEVRTMINDWMRSADSQMDGIIDFESAVADPENPKNVLEEYTHEDGLHPYDGYEVMANAIDLTLFE